MGESEQEVTTIKWEDRKKFVIPDKYYLVQVRDYVEAQYVAKQKPPPKAKQHTAAYYLERGPYKASGNYLLLVVEE